MFICKLCAGEIPAGKEIELDDPEVVLMMNFIKLDYKKLVTGEQNSFACSECMNTMKITYNFIMLCMKTEIKLRNCVDQNKYPQNRFATLEKLLEINSGTVSSQNNHICRICLRVTTELFFNMNERYKGMQVPIEQMLSGCSSSLDLSITKESIICENCVNLLITSFTFYEKNKLLKRLSERMMINQEDNCDVDYVKTEFSEKDTEDSQVLLPNVIYVKEEPSSLDINEEVKIEDNSEPILRIQGEIGGKPYKPVSKRYFCQTCSYTTKRKACLIKHKIVHFPDYKKPLFKCNQCGYTVKSQKYLDRHMSLHANGMDFKKFKCELCSFSTKKRSKLDRHLTVHKDERETMMYKCSKCMFITKWKGYLTQHELTHNETEEKKFKCKECDFSTNWRGSLLQHKVVHLSGDDAFKFSCDQCSFKTKRKDNLSKHMIRHMKDEDVRIFYCSECPFTSKFSSKLARHMHVHKQGDDLTTYSCTDCSFQTRWKNNLQQHMRVHQDASEIPLFKCKDCSFTTKWKTCLTEHEVMHKTGDDSKEHKCTECSFTTKWKKSLNMHILTHTTDESVKKFKCAMCEYKTYRSHHLKRHMQVHYK